MHTEGMYAPSTLLHNCASSMLQTSVVPSLFKDCCTEPKMSSAEACHCCTNLYHHYCAMLRRILSEQQVRTLSNILKVLLGKV